jgi:MFS family permease
MDAQSNPPVQSSWRTPVVIMVAGCLIAMLGFGVRAIYGLFLEPMSSANGWSRETFALAMAIQYLLWGVGAPIAGALADRYGPPVVLVVGALFYAAGTWGMAVSDTGWMLHLTGGVITGIGVAMTAFTIALAAMAKVVGPEKRSMVLGLGTAAGSLGQVLFSPMGQGFIDGFGWQPALYILAAIVLFIIPLALILPSDPSAKGEIEVNQSMSAALSEAAGHRGFVLLTIGFFVCGFHVAFITVHLPAYVTDVGLTASVGAVALAIVGVFNIFGSFASGYVGQRWSKKWSLSFIYAGRAVVIAAFLFAPKTELTIYLFAAAMGILWLSTVPLTSGIVAQVFGARYMTTLFGIVFFSHQIGSFIGIWLGGRLYDTTGSYDAMWWWGIALGIAAALIHMPINEKPLARLVTPAA